MFGLSLERPILGDNPKAHHFSWWKVCAVHIKSKQNQLIQHRSLILTWSFLEYRGKANQVYLIFWWYLVVHVVHVCVNGTCIHTYWPGFVGLFMKSGTFHEKHMKNTKKTKKKKKQKKNKKKNPADSTQISHFYLVFHRVQRESPFHMKSSTFHENHLKSNKKQLIPHRSLILTWYFRVQREGQLGISYILVVFGGACGTCMCKWCMYTHILPWFCWFSWKVVLFIWKAALFMKSTWKATKHSWFNTDLSFWPGPS